MGDRWILPDVDVRLRCLRTPTQQGDATTMSLTDTDRAKLDCIASELNDPNGEMDAVTFSSSRDRDDARSAASPLKSRDDKRLSLKESERTPDAMIVCMGDGK